jgi:hypothetical protein
MAPPQLTAEQRAAALKKAGEVRAQRAVIKQRLKRGTLSAPEALAAARTDDVVGKLRVSVLLESLPGIGKVRAGQIMKQVGIAPTRRVQGLGELQRVALLAELGYYPAPATRTGS